MVTKTDSFGENTEQHLAVLAEAAQAEAEETADLMQMEVERRPRLFGVTFDQNNTGMFEDGVSLNLNGDKGSLGLTIVDATLLPKGGAYETYLRAHALAGAKDRLDVRDLLAMGIGYPTPGITFIYEFDYEIDDYVHVREVSFAGAAKTAFEPLENFYFGDDDKWVRGKLDHVVGVNGYEILLTIGDIFNDRNLGLKRTKMKRTEMSVLTGELSVELGNTVANQLISRGEKAVYYERPFNTENQFLHALRDLNGFAAGCSNARLSSPLRYPADLVNLRTYVDVVLDGKPSPYTPEQIDAVPSAKDIKVKRV